MAFAVLGFSVPVFVVGYVLILLFALARLAAGAGLHALSRGLLAVPRAT
jgi:ABC-type dipeptide/oligopeptide/nickel transport system permease component